MIWRTLIGEMPYLLAGALVALRLLFYFIALGLVLGVALALMQIYGNRPLLASAFVFERFFRGVPAIVLLFLFYYGLSDVYNISAFAAATVALGLRSAAYQSQIFKGAIQAVPSGQMMASRAIGMSDLQALRYVIIPQAIRLVIGPWSNEFTSELKDTSLAFTIGVVELLRRGRHIVAYTRGNGLIVYGTCAVIYFILCRAGNMILYYLEDRLWVPGFERRER